MTNCSPVLVTRVLNTIRAHPDGITIDQIRAKLAYRVKHRTVVAAVVKARKAGVGINSRRGSKYSRYTYRDNG